MNSIKSRQVSKSIQVNGSETNNNIEIDRKKYKNLSPKEREKLVIEAHNLNNITQPDINILNKISEGVWSKFEKGNSLVPSVYIGTKTYDIPLVSEEASVVAGIQKASKLSNLNGIKGSSNEYSEMIGQIPFKKNTNESVDELISYIKPFEEQLIEHARTIQKVKNLETRGGGFLGKLKFKKTDDKFGKIEFIVDVKDAMGATIVNEIAENIQRSLEKLGIKTLTGILTNAAPKRKSYATIEINIDALDDNQKSGLEIAENIVDLYKFAKSDKNRALTHNKGIMNGVIALAEATGQDTRALEAANHFNAIDKGTNFEDENTQYGPISTWKIEEGMLIGNIELSTPITTVGRLIEIHPTINTNLIKILKVDDTKEFGIIMAAVGLLSNLAALLALSTTGISYGHGKLHNQK